MAVARSFRQELVGVFGHPVAENPTQAMLEPAFADMGLDWRYLTVEVRPEDLGDAVRGACAMNWRIQLHDPPQDRRDPPPRPAQPGGGSHRGRQLRHQPRRRVDRRQPDGKGFLESVSGVRPVRGMDVVVLAAGGAARAIAVELALAGAARLTIVNRTIDRAEELARIIRDRTGVAASSVKWEAMYRIPESADLVVNATSIDRSPGFPSRSRA